MVIYMTLNLLALVVTGSIDLQYHPDMIHMVNMVLMTINSGGYSEYIVCTR